MADNAHDAFLIELAAGHGGWKLSALAAVTTNHSREGLAPAGGITPDEGDRMLLAGQTDATQNGLYNASASGWTRCADLATTAYLALGLAVWVRFGTHANSLWTLTDPTVGIPQINVDELTFTKWVPPVPANIDVDTVTADSVETDGIANSDGTLALSGATGITLNHAGLAFTVTLTGNVARFIGSGSSGLLISTAAGAATINGATGVVLQYGAAANFTADLSSNVSRFVGAGSSGVRIEASTGNLELRAPASSGIVVSEGTNTLCTFTRNGSNQVVQTVHSGRAGFGFEAIGASQYIYMRCGSSGGVYADCPTFYVRNAAGDTNVCTIADTANFTTINGYGTAGMNIGPAIKVGAGAGTPLYLHGQAVQAGDVGTSKSGDINVQLGKVIGTGDQSSGALKLYDHLGPTLAISNFGIDGVGGGTYGILFQTTATGVDGRARNVSLNFNSPIQTSFVGGASDFTMDANGLVFRVSSAQRINASATNTTIATTAAGYNAFEWAGSTGLHKKPEYWNRVQTTDATVTTAFTSPTIPNSTVVHVTAKVVAANNLGTQGASYERKASFRCTSAGVLILLGSVTSAHTAEDTAGWDCTLDATGATFRVRVTGAAATNIGWETYVEIAYGGPHA